MIEFVPGRRVLAATTVIAMMITACTSGQGSPSPPQASPSSAVASPSTSDRQATPVPVTLQEWAVVPAADTAAAGPITFQIMNAGPDDVHEFVVIKTDLDAGSLPTDATGAVIEEGEGMAVVDEIEEIPVGEAQDLTVTLEAGRYVLLCNIYDETENEAHYSMGMRVPFTVTG